ncbi:MAG: 2-isopropylmalate synthase [Mailhella sp.]|nr:2-isopropylmalate synthase [Mailhella sp.]
MADRVYIFDTTLRDGEQSPGATMNFQEKLRLAAQLEALGVDCIEAGFPGSSQGDFDSVKAIAETVKECSVAGLTRCISSEIERTWEAIKNAAHPRIHVFLATSPIHMEYKLRKTPDQIIEMIRKGVTLACSLCPEVEFSAEDASRSDPDFLVRVAQTAIECGARIINLPDTVGYAIPDDYAKLISYVIENCPNSDKAIFSVHCHDDLGLAVANSLAAIKAGARQAEVTLSGIGERAGNTALEEFVMAMRVRKDFFDCTDNIRISQLYPSCRMLSVIIGQPIPTNKAVTGGNAFLHESGVHQDGVLKNRCTYEIMTPESIGRQTSDLVIGKHSGRAALRSKLESLGYASLSDEEVETVFTAVKALADKKKTIHDEDIESLVVGEIYRTPDRYRLVTLSVQSSGENLPAICAMAMEVNGEVRRHAGFGVGPVDATFNVINHLTGREPRLDRYSVNAITGGTDAQGEVTVRLMDGGLAATGRGSDPDVIISSAKAYIDALNRIAAKEKD